MFRLRWLFALFLVFSVPTFGRDFPTIDPTDIVAKYGKPDKIKSTEHDKPRPPIVTRMLEYRKEHVRFVLFADAPMGSPPLYDSWKLMGTQDPRDNSVISDKEAAQRLQSRVRN